MILRAAGSKELSHVLASIHRLPSSLHPPTSPNNIGMPFFTVPPITIPIIVSVHRWQLAAIGSPLTTTRICDIVACPYFKDATCANFWGAADNSISLPIMLLWWLSSVLLVMFFTVLLLHFTNIFLGGFDPHLPPPESSAPRCSINIYCRL